MLKFDFLCLSHTLTSVICSIRDVVELKEAIRIKEAEGDAYISDIEVRFFICQYCFWVWVKCIVFAIQTVGQAYEDMQTQNQHLLQQLTDRDDFNIKVFICSLLFHFHGCKLITTDWIGDTCPGFLCQSRQWHYLLYEKSWKAVKFQTTLLFLSC